MRSFAVPKQFHHSCFVGEAEFLRELNVEFDHQIASLPRLALHGHSLARDHPLGLRRDDFVEMEVDEFAAEFFLTSKLATSVMDLASRASMRLISAV